LTLISMGEFLTVRKNDVGTIIRCFSPVA